MACKLEPKLSYAYMLPIRAVLLMNCLRGAMRVRPGHGVLLAGVQQNDEKKKAGSTRGPSTGGRGGRGLPAGCRPGAPCCSPSSGPEPFLSSWLISNTTDVQMLYSTRKGPPHTAAPIWNHLSFQEHQHSPSTSARILYKYLGTQGR